MITDVFESNHQHTAKTSKTTDKTNKTVFELKLATRKFWKILIHGRFKLFEWFWILMFWRIEEVWNFSTQELPFWLLLLLNHYSYWRTSKHSNLKCNVECQSQFVNINSFEVFHKNSKVGPNGKLKHYGGKCVNGK